MQTELHDYVMGHGVTELSKRLENIDTGQLFTLLDDTVQMDMMNLSHEEWTFIRSKKVVYCAILRELQKRVSVPERKRNEKVV